MNLHKRIAQHLPDLKNVISDKECLAINRKDYAIGEAGPLMAFLQAVKTGFNPEGLADYELFSLALALSYTSLPGIRVRIVSVSKGTDAIAGAVHYACWLRGQGVVQPLCISQARVNWEATGPSSASWLANMVKGKSEPTKKYPLWIFADYAEEGAQVELERLMFTGSIGFARHASHADARVKNPSSERSYLYAFSTIGYAIAVPTNLRSPRYTNGGRN